MSTSHLTSVHTVHIHTCDGACGCPGIDFTRGPDYWLISIAALPFGTFGEMLGGDVVPPVPGQFCGESCANKW